MSTFDLRNPDTWTNSTVSVGATSTLLKAKNDARKAIVFENISNELIYISLGSAATSSGFALYPGGSAQFSLSDNTNFIGAIYGICASGSKNINIQEGV